ncbi:MAG: hypothetical protein K2X66_01190, partial [Cyanobacteria bacterium]|nr:hypothetical protein [Cyanobacteriota bacterium]
IQAKLVGMPPCPWKNSSLCGVSQVQWSPKGEMLGFVLHHQWVGFTKWDENLFYQGFLKPGSESNLVDLGKNNLKVGNFITNARWTPSGKHLLLLDAPQKMPRLHRRKELPGEVISVQVQSEGDSPLRVVSRSPIGLNPFGLDINPKGTLVVTVNTENTDRVSRFPLRFLNKRNFSSLSLVSVEPELGTLNTLSPPLYFRGALSKSVVFDNVGEMIAVSVPQDSDWDLRDKSLNYGWVEFFQIHQTPSHFPQLLPTHIRLKVPRGANDLVLFH